MKAGDAAQSVDRPHHVRNDASRPETASTSTHPCVSSGGHSSAGGNPSSRRPFQEAMLAPLALIVCAAGGSAVVRAEGFEVFLAAPKGWSIDVLSKRGEGLPAVLVRKGEAFDVAKNVMFLQLDRRELPDLAAFVANRRRDFLKDRPGAKVRPLAGLTAGDGHPALLLDFDDPSIPQYERRAYVLAQDGVATLFLQCATPQARSSHAAALGALVQSYRDLHAPHPR